MMEDRRSIRFDNKIPLTWLLSSAGTVLLLLITVLWNVANQSNKLDQLVVQSLKNEQHNIERDSKFEVLIRDSYEAKRNADVLSIRVDNLEKGPHK